MNENKIQQMCVKYIIGEIIGIKKTYLFHSRIAFNVVWQIAKGEMPTDKIFIIALGHASMISGAQRARKVFDRSIKFGNKKQIVKMIREGVLNEHL